MIQLSAAMKMAKIAVKTGGRFIVKHAPTILTGIGTVGVVVGVILTAKKTPDAKEELDQVKEEWEAIEDKEKRVKADYIFKRIRVGAKHYWVVAVIIGGSIFCFWLANHISLKRLMSALTALSISAKSKEELEEKIKELDGDKHLKKIKDEINSDKLKNETKTIDPERELTPGESWFYEPGSRQIFRSSYERIRQTIVNIKEDLMYQIEIDGERIAWVPVNDFLMDIGAEPCDFGNDLVFGVEVVSNDISKKNLKELVDAACDIGFTAEWKDNIPVGAIRYDCHLRHKDLFERR